MSTLPPGALERKSSISVGKQVADSETDSDLEDSTHILSVSSASRVSLPRLDERTSKRLQTLSAPSHINSLIRATQNHTAARVALCDFLFALCNAWSGRLDSILSTVVVSTGGGLVRELYRGYVRSSPLGKAVSLPMLLGMSSPLAHFTSSHAYADPANADSWAPLLFLTDLYAHSLLTMGDDEFFSGLAAPARPNAPRNPLTLDEVTSLSRKLLNIAFTLFWREGQIGAQDGLVPGLNIEWETVRRKVTRLLQAVHAREYVARLSCIHSLIWGLAVRGGRSCRPATGWWMNTSTSNRSLRPPCEFFSAILSDFL